MKARTAARLASSLWGVCMVLIVLSFLVPGEDRALLESLLAGV
jgi:hypothetical protein